MIKRFLIAIVLLVLVCGGIVGFNLFRAKMIKQYFANMKQPAATVSTVTVKPQAWQPGIDAIGTASARRGVDVAVETAGVVKDINFKANQKVNKGDVLVQLNDEVEQADLASAQSALKLAEENLDRARQLTQRGVSATSSLQSAQSQANQAQSTVEKLKAVLDQKQVKAPFSGTIGIPQIDLGEYLKVGTAIATLQSLKTMRVDFTVPESDFDSLHLGQTIHVGVNEGKLPFSGQIIGINPRIDPSSRLVSVRGEVDNTSGGLQPGQFVHVRVQLPKEQNVVALPQTAVTTSLYGDYVFVVRHAPEEKAKTSQTSGGNAGAANAEENNAGEKKENKKSGEQLVVRQVFVTLGRHNDQQVEVEKGVKPGDVVVTAGQNRLSSGMPVTIDNTINPARAAQKEAAL